MKKLISIIGEVFSARKKLASAESWVKYLESEVNYLNRSIVAINQVNARNIDDLVSENESLSGANAQLIKEAAAARVMAERMRGKQFATAATPKEHEFLNVCAAIHDSGKVIKGRTFVTMMGAAIRERRSATKNRFGGNGDISALWGCRAGSKGDTGVKRPAAVK